MCLGCMACAAQHQEADIELNGTVVQLPLMLCVCAAPSGACILCSSASHFHTICVRQRAMPAVAGLVMQLRRRAT
jgi:hypothetical protein